MGLSFPVVISRRQLDIKSPQCLRKSSALALSFVLKPFHIPQLGYTENEGQIKCLRWTQLQYNYCIDYGKVSMVGGVSIRAATKPFIEGLRGAVEVSQAPTDSTYRASLLFFH